MGFSHLLNTNADIEAFKTKFDIPHDVHIAYYHKGDIEDQRLLWVVFFPLMAILKGEVRFPIDPLYLGPSSFMGLAPTSACPIFIGW